MVFMLMPFIMFCMSMVVISNNVAKIRFLHKSTQNHILSDNKMVTQQQQQ